MNLSFTRNLILIGLLTGGSLVNPQQRQVDLENHIEEPAKATVFQSGETFSLVLSITNNGPEELLEGDTRQQGPHRNTGKLNIHRSPFLDYHPSSNPIDSKKTEI